MVAERIAFLIDDKGDGENDETEKERTHGVDLGFEKVGEDEDGGAHADDPAEAEFREEFEGVELVRLFAIDESVERVDEFIIKTKDKGNRATGDTGDAVG